MFYGKEQKIETAKRLKKLRNNYNNGRGISHEKLARELNERYSDLEKSKKNNYLGSAKAEVISSGVLKNYEITDFNHSKFNAGYGMNISYLTMLADFYGVTTDYLLGRTGVKSPDIDIQEIHEKTGLSENAINKLKEYIDEANSFKKEIESMGYDNEEYFYSADELLKALSGMICHAEMDIIGRKISELKREKRKQQKKEQSAIATLKKEILASAAVADFNRTATDTRMIPAEDYIDYLLNDISTRITSVMKDVISSMDEPTE